MRFNRTLIVVVGMALAGAHALAQGQTSQVAGDVLRPGPGIVNPTELKFTEPSYTQAAIDARIQGMVVLEIVVLANGTVGDAKVIRPLDPGLDQEAIKAAKQWLFRPAMKDGRPYPILVTLEMMFRLPPSTSGRVSTGPSGVRQAVVATPPQQDRIKLPDDGFAAGAYAEDTPGLIAPKVTYQTEPKYTSDAMRAKIQGVVVVEAIIGVNGTATKARVAESLDKVYGLDQEALKALLNWTFTPGMLAGQPVPVYAKLTFVFRLH